MREIKFRAWDTSKKYFTIDKMFVFVLVDIIGNPHQRMIVRSPDLYPLMQYTGLKDYHQQEIYDGDILTFTEIDEDSCMGREETHTGVVKWIEDIAQWRFIYHSGQRRELHLVTDLEPVTECRVIGNIYENPDLIK